MAEKYFWATVRDYATNWVVGGAILVATGFAPEEWTARLVRGIRFPEFVAANWPAAFDIRTMLVLVGIAVIAGDVLIRRKAATRSHDAAVTVAAPAQGTAPSLALPDKPSLAVLPFTNLSGDAEQEYFCDGMVEDIITGLSRMKWLFVIARNSSFTYKGKAVDVKQVGRELGVRYVLEGSVRKSSNRVRIAGQLIDAESGSHVWADRFEGELADIFDLQDEITSSVVGAIAPALTAAEIHRSLSKSTASLEAYDYYLRALDLSHSLHSMTAKYIEDGVGFCKKAIALDANFALAYALAAQFRAWRTTQGPVSEEERSEGIEFALRALDLANDNPTALWMGGTSLMHLAREFERSHAAIERSLAIDPNSAFAWRASGHFHWWSGDGSAAIQDFERAKRLSPRDPDLPVFLLGGMGWAHFVEGRYEEALRYSDLALNQYPNNAASITSLRCKIASLAQLGRIAEAKHALALLRKRQPNPTVALLREAMPMRREGDMARYLDGLRKAGLPE